MWHVVWPCDHVIKSNLCISEKGLKKYLGKMMSKHSNIKQLNKEGGPSQVVLLILPTHLPN